MFSFTAHSIFVVVGDGIRNFVIHYKVHPILVNFTAALIPVSLMSDILGWKLAKASLRDTGWWTLCFAAIITPATALSGWLFWMDDDDGVAGMTIHRWLGTALIVVVLVLAGWRWSYFKDNRWPSVLYFLGTLALVAALVYQGHLGGEQSFSMME
jgi:uncharacterized membrane protein